MRWPDLGDLGRIRPEALWPKVNAEKAHLKLTSRELGLRIGCSPLDLEDWSLGRPPGAATLLIAELWARESQAAREGGA